MDTPTLNYFLAAPDLIPQSAFEITPSDGDLLPKIATGIHVGIAGDVSVENLLGNTVTFENVTQGQLLETGSIRKVLSTGTTATNLIAYYYVTIQPSV